MIKLLVNNKPIYIPEKNSNRSGLTKDISTSFLDEFYKKTKNNKLHQEECMRAYCLNKVHDRIKGTYNSYLEILGGVGVTAKIFEEDNVAVYLNDLDEDCVFALMRNFPYGNITQQDMFKYFDYISMHYDVIFLDYNNYALKKFFGIYNKTTKDAFLFSNRYVIINDCSPYALKYGKKSFDLYSKILEKEVNTIEEYFKELKNFYRKQCFSNLISVDYFNKSSYLLFDRNGDKELDIKFHSLEDMHKNPVLKLVSPLENFFE